MAFSFQKASGDLNFIIRYLRREYPNKKLNIFAHSLGTFVTVILSPEKINKTVFTGAINLDLKLISKKIEDRILLAGGRVDKNGITVYPRTSGAVQLVGKDYWKILDNNNLIPFFQEYAQKTDLIVFKSLQDEVVGSDKSFDDYKKISGLKYVEINGDHNFTNPQDRQNLLKEIDKFLKN